MQACVRIISIVLGAVLFASTPLHAQPVSVPFTETHALESEILGETLTVQAGFPLRQIPDDARVPVVIILDSDVMFAMGTEILRLMSFEQSAPMVLTVGISYGSLQDWLAKRGRDYSPGVSPDDGIRRFRMVLETEVFPLLQAQYPQADFSQAYLYGHSTAGTAALDTALTRPDLFAGILASSPSVEERTDWFEATLATWDGQLPERFYLSVGGRETATRSVLEEGDDRLLRTTSNQQFVVFDDMPHMAVIPGAFAAGMMWMFADETAD